MSTDISDPGHGHSPAAWTAVIVMLAAVTIGTVAFWFAQVWLVWASVALIGVGALLGWILSKAGWGVRGPKYVTKSH
ncbi:membrane protein YdbS with pleckstrin-like domain [Mycetocola sp. BIGb0189]|uniref:DUF6704 family protein n=1 Tax=Mycetocola sp. BIGb0189 TaxID=2940604 RepID=UPI00216850F2|nr:DUF6704 family protein [Mycetocola sp. BIGb0189]MCS4276200.1 membrane protein YdbS with pleckstrin-like domain [Mycetocola sp. BIGb0189]